MNENLSELVELVKRHKFPKLRRVRSYGRVFDLRKEIGAEAEEGKKITIARYQEAFNMPEVQDLFGLVDPIVMDFTPYLGIKGDGKVYGLCLNSMGPTQSLKDPVIAGLFLMHLMTPGVPIEEMDTLADCGIFNSANAARHYAEHFGLRAEYWMPSEMEHLAKELKGLVVHHEDPKYEGEVKNACYKTMLDRLLNDSEFSNRTFYLGHSELGWVAMYPVAERNAEILQDMSVRPTVLLSGVGAGTFFVPHSEVFFEMFGTRSVLGEYEVSHPMTKIHDLNSSVVGMPDYVTDEEEGFSGHTITRRFAENPFIPSSFWKRMERSMLIETGADYATVMHLRDQGVDVGITTGGVLAAAYHLANQGEVVVVPVYEGFKDYRK